MTTLRELLDRVAEQDVADESAWVTRAIETWAYGSEEECPKCGGDPRNPRSGGLSLNVARSIAQAAECLCHGTGKVRTPGLVERVRDRPPFIEALAQELGSAHTEG